MHNRIIMLAKIALIIAAAQIHITAADFISNPANMPSNATYAMSNEEKPTIFQAFKNEIESTVKPQTKNFLSDADLQNITKTIQNFIHNEEGIALALYIANQWGIISKLGWNSDAVFNYVQSCLGNSYNSTMSDNTIQIENEWHSDIEHAIKNLRITSDIATNKLRIQLIKILTPTRVIRTQNQTKADTQTDRESINDLTPEEGKLIKLLNSIFPVFHILADKSTNNHCTEIVELINQVSLPYYTYYPNTSLNWFLATAYLHYEPDGLKGENLSSPNQLIVTLHLYQPELLLALQLSHIHKIQYEPALFTEWEITELDQMIDRITYYKLIPISMEGTEAEKQDIPPPPLLCQICKEIETVVDNYNKTQSNEQYLKTEFLKFITGWCSKEPFKKYNRSTLFQDAAEKFRTASQYKISVQLTDKQKEFLKQLEIAYKIAIETLICDNYESCYAMKCLSIYLEILQKVLAASKIKASQIVQELKRHIKELQAEEAKYKEQEAIEETCIATLDKSTNDLAQLLQIENTQPNVEQLLYEIGQQLYQIQNNDQLKEQYFQQLYAKSDTSSNKTNPQAKTTSIGVEYTNKETPLKNKLTLIQNYLDKHKSDINIIAKYAETNINQKITEISEKLQQLYGIAKEIISKEAKSIQERERKEQEERERAEKIEELIKGINENLNQNKEQGSQISTTQKIINNLNATNKMLQIINLILY